jgi:hypothetical protein
LSTIIYVSFSSEYNTHPYACSFNNIAVLQLVYYTIELQGDPCHIQKMHSLVFTARLSSDLFHLDIHDRRIALTEFLDSTLSGMSICFCWKVLES